MNQTISIPDLRAEFDGRAIAPGDPGYDQARTVAMGGIDRRPAVIIRPVDATEVTRVVGLARETGRELAIRSGGHSGAGHGVTEGGIMLDLANLRGLEIDPVQRTAWVQTGLTAGEYATATAAHGLATGFGDTGSVGIGGITLGGGVGYLSRKHGLTIDDLLAAELVTADGELLRVDASNHPELFWAIRGGGGNFGVATRFQFRLHPLETVVGGMLLLPASAEVVDGFVTEAQAAPEELSGIAMVMPAPPMPFIPEEHRGKLVLLALLCYSGDPDDGKRVFAPFRKLATPLTDMLAPMPYPQLFAAEEGEDFRPTVASRMLFRDGFDRGTAETIVEQLRAAGPGMHAVQIRVLGGAIARVPADATAYPHRARQMMINVISFYQSTEDRPVREKWVEELAGRLGQGSTDAYVNFLGDEGPDRVRDAYPGPTWERLRAVKGRYDPTNLFRLNQNVPPGGDGERAPE